MNLTGTLWENTLIPFAHPQAPFSLSSGGWFVIAAIVILLGYVMFAPSRGAADS